MQFFTLHLYYSETYQALFTCKYARPLPPVKDFFYFTLKSMKVKKNELLRYSNPIRAINDTSFIQSGIYKALDV